MKKEWEQAIRAGDVEAARTLLDRGEPVDARDKHGQTGLMLAAREGRTELVSLLIERGAALNITAKFSLSALMLAVINDHIEVVRLLCEAGADRDIKGSGAPGFFGKTALDLAKGAGREEMVEILSSEGDVPPG